MNAITVQLQMGVLDVLHETGKVKAHIIKEPLIFALCINQELYQMFIIEINIIDKLGLKKE